MIVGITNFYNSYDIWELRHKVLFDGINRVISINPTESLIDVKVDLFSDWKEWSLNRENLRFVPAFRSVGGDTTTSGNFLGSTYFTINNWQIATDHGVEFDGNMFSDDRDTVVSGIGDVKIASYKFSNLVDAIAVSTADLISAGIATTGTITTQTATLQTTIPTGVVGTLNDTNYDGVPYSDIMEIILSMAQGRIVESATGVYDFYSQNNTGVLYTLTKAGDERNRT